MAAVYGEHPAAVSVAFAENRFEDLNRGHLSLVRAKHEDQARALMAD